MQAKNIKYIIAVASGKGGVGKSTVAVNLALALAKQGGQVGLLDADIYGPSQPTLLGTASERPVFNDKGLQPIVRYGIPTMSIGYLIDAATPVVWRGPMLGKALQQLMQDTEWKDLDYLVVDLPPGTGDVQLTLCQKLAVSGVLLVTTPQEVALVDVRRAHAMFTKLNVPILGVVENMSVYHCPQCHHEERIFGEGGAAKLAQENGIDLLGALPLDKAVREKSDAGHPLMIAEPNSNYANIMNAIAERTIGKLALQPKDYSAKFPKIVVEQTKRSHLE